jgi:hypothetical protein
MGGGATAGMGAKGGGVVGEAAGAELLMRSLGCAATGTGGASG